MICEKATKCLDINCPDKVEHEEDEFCDRECIGEILGTFKGAKCIEVSNKEKK